MVMQDVLSHKYRFTCNYLLKIMLNILFRLELLELSSSSGVSAGILHLHVEYLGPSTVPSHLKHFNTLFTCTDASLSTPLANGESKKVFNSLEDAVLSL